MGNGGWYLLAGDEFGVIHRPYVFKEYVEVNSVNEKWGGKEDISAFIKNINLILSSFLCAKQGDQLELIYHRIQNNNLIIVKKVCKYDDSEYLIILTNDNEFQLSDVKEIPGVETFDPNHMFILHNDELKLGSELSEVEVPSTAYTY